MKKLMLITSLFIVCILTSCSKTSNNFINDDTLNYYGIIELKDLVSSDVYYTEEHGTRIQSYLYYNNDVEFQNLVEDLYEMLLNEELYSYCGYIPPTEIMKTSNKKIMRSTKLEDHYINDNDMNKDSITLTSCIFVYKNINNETIYQLEITSYPEVKVINNKEFNVIINLSKQSFYVCE